MNALKAAWTVRAGVIPGVPMAEYDRQWTLVSADWEGKTDAEKAEIFHARADEATAYARAITDPGRVNFVTMEFLWL